MTSTSSTGHLVLFLFLFCTSSSFVVSLSFSRGGTTAYLVCWLAWVCAFRIEYVGMALHCLNVLTSSWYCVYLRCISLCPHTYIHRCSTSLGRTINTGTGCAGCLWVERTVLCEQHTPHTAGGATSRYTGKWATRVILCEKSENIIKIRKTQKSWSRLDFRKWVRSIYVHWLRVL